MAYLRKQKSLQKLRLSTKVFENKFYQIVKKIIKRLRFVFALFGFVEAAKFRDSGEFSDSVQTVWQKVTKEILHSAKRPRNMFSPKVLLNVCSGSLKR